ncbi:hypothetical protein [Helicobacter sp. T3_23-1056]
MQGLTKILQAGLAALCIMSFSACGLIFDSDERDRTFSVMFISESQDIDASFKQMEANAKEMETTIKEIEANMEQLKTNVKQKEKIEKEIEANEKKYNKEIARLHQELAVLEDKRFFYATREDIYALQHIQGKIDTIESKIQALRCKNTNCHIFEQNGRLTEKYLELRKTLFSESCSSRISGGNITIQDIGGIGKCGLFKKHDILKTHIIKLKNKECASYHGAEWRPSRLKEGQEGCYEEAKNLDISMQTRFGGIIEGAKEKVKDFESNFEIE